jgi:hypothetical protein
MLRKFSVVAVAAALLGAAALAPTSASAHEYGGWHHGWGRWGGLPIVVDSPVYYGGYGYGYDHDHRHCRPRWRPF